MSRRVLVPRLCTGLRSVLLVAATGLCFAADEVYISLPDLGEVRKLDLDTGILEPWATGIQSPFYGMWGPDDHLYIQDFGQATVWKVAPDGSKTVVTSGGLIRAPLSVAVHPTTAELYVSDAFYQHLVIVDPVTGDQRVFVDNVGGLFLVPGGLSFDMQGNLFMTDHGTHDIIKIDPLGNATVFLDGPSNGIAVPAGIEVDRSGSIFVASYDNYNILRIRQDTAEFEVFCDDPILEDPNDVTFASDGSILTTCADSHALVRIDALGRATVLYQDAALGEFLGVAVRRTSTCTGYMQEYGTGTPGEGGFVPRFSGYFNPCPGGELGYLIDRANGGASGFFLFSFGQASYPTWGGHLYTSFSTAWGFIPFTFAGVGAGAGSARFRFLHPDDPNLDGVGFFLQALSFDDQNPWGIAMSNGLEVRFGHL